MKFTVFCDVTQCSLVHGYHVLEQPAATWRYIPGEINHSIHGSEKRKFREY
jgi:hypothetical protein